MPDYERNRQSHAEHMYHQTDRHRGELASKETGMKSERRYDEIHKCVNRDAVNQTANKCLLYENCERSASGIEDCACGECDQEMQRKTHSSGAKPTLLRVCAKEPAGYVLQHPHWATACRQSAVDESSRDVQYPGYQTAPEDCLITLLAFPLIALWTLRS